jgi:hypothetical protein
MKPTKFKTTKNKMTEMQTAGGKLLKMEAEYKPL